MNANVQPILEYGSDQWLARFRKFNPTAEIVGWRGLEGNKRLLVRMCRHRFEEVKIYEVTGSPQAPELKELW